MGLLVSLRSPQTKLLQIHHLLPEEQNRRVKKVALHCKIVLRHVTEPHFSSAHWLNSVEAGITLKLGLHSRELTNFKDNQKKQRMYFGGASSLRKDERFGTGVKLVDLAMYYKRYSDEVWSLGFGWGWCSSMISWHTNIGQYMPLERNNDSAPIEAGSCGQLRTK